MNEIERIKYKEMLQIIQNQMIEVMEEDYEYYKDFEVKIGLEQDFIKLQNSELNKKAIYMVVKFSIAEVTYGESVLPFTIIAMSEANKLEACNKLLLDYTYKFNLNRVSDNNIQQVYETPTISSNFNIVTSDFRSLLSVSGVFILSKNANYYTFYYEYMDSKTGKTVKEEIPFITAAFNGTISLDSQVFYGRKNYTQSVGKFGTLSFSIVTYILSNIQLVNDSLKILTKQSDINKDFNISIEFKSGLKIKDVFKLASVDSNEELGQIPMISLSFTN